MTTDRDGNEHPSLPMAPRPSRLRGVVRGQLRSVAVGLSAGVGVVAVFTTLMLLFGGGRSAMEFFHSMFRWRHLLSILGVSAMVYLRHRQSENGASD